MIIYFPEIIGCFTIYSFFKIDIILTIIIPISSDIIYFVFIIADCLLLLFLYLRAAETSVFVYAVFDFDVDSVVSACLDCCACVDALD